MDKELPWIGDVPPAHFNLAAFSCGCNTRLAAVGSAEECNLITEVNSIRPQLRNPNPCRRSSTQSEMGHRCQLFSPSTADRLSSSACTAERQDRSLLRWFGEDVVS
ncbi:hypothetical protein BDV37DRAFT_241783 [Aspergillus pseudonomiae]|uniref:Uncharacterized protein n=1 Tax=Aspergillus pseudonomiae TaxID=1506151 RepID=A0A5N7DL55_9EURO|nr:uncharacterized protein BDV37DRAFT_241783 [Aspergillus pseudonomiae]KAE8407035.1 hypothetical protein BDV37DRAFT_241783 [Aspergillus pseudonomiae]